MVFLQPALISKEQVKPKYFLDSVVMLENRNLMGDKFNMGSSSELLLRYEYLTSM